MFFTAPGITIRMNINEVKRTKKIDNISLTINDFKKKEKRTHRNRAPIKKFSINFKFIIATLNQIFYKLKT